MKKLTILLTAFVFASLTLFSLTAQAEGTTTAKASVVEQMRAATTVAHGPGSMRERVAAIDGADKQAEVSRADLPKVAILYLNNAKTTYDNEVDQSVLGNLGKAIPETKYNLVDGTPYLEKLNKMGIVDLSTAERGDIVDAFQGEGIDYCVFLEVQPFVARDKLTFFTVGKDITAIMPVKIIDLVNNRYLYNGKFTEKASDSTMIGGIGNKSVALKALAKIDQQIASVIEVRLPAGKAVKVAVAK
jgi:hypothetical protein